MSDPGLRRHDLDWIRIGAFLLLILYHVGMFYVPWDWHVKSPQPIAWLEPVMLLTNPWRLSLLFLVSGAATRFMADKLAPGVLARQRTARLLPPLVFGMLIIVPPQSYYEIVEQLSFDQGYLAFYGRYLTASGNWCDADGCLITPTWNHLWFVAYLLVYTLALAGLIVWAKPALRGLEQQLERLPAWALVVAPIAFLGLARAILLPRFGVTHTLVDDGYNHVLSFSMFLFGYLTAKSGIIRDRLIALRWPALGLAICAYLAFSLYAWTWRDATTAPAAGLVVTMRFVYAVDQWCAIVAILGFGARHLNRSHPALSYLTLAVFPYYIVHQTVIVVAGHHLARVGLPQGLEAALLIGLTVATCGVTYEIVRRTGLLRPLFGLKPEASAKSSPDRALPIQNG
ncbi:acyltransferase family protein [Phenylobacterium sp.]|uniref:acyltransferase family protein n=1 Tax=Phenylobacterium sp. TaxID=1871053 RepID=UPI00272F0DCC|nr:acyltransferase family protein [Phenylobacterium sp.]MDP1617936.1 acyltransferase family protein [Phenylobacterium sp.]MDP1986003.1 acyltransferase family protein [Phenylobacterium sp.]